jgi:roadblock/LC7 domain-containing protein
MALIQKAHGSGFGVPPNDLYGVLVDIQSDLNNAKADVAAIILAANTSLAAIHALTPATATLKTQVRVE